MYNIASVTDTRIIGVLNTPTLLDWYERFHLVDRYDDFWALSLLSDPPGLLNPHLRAWVPPSP